MKVKVGCSMDLQGARIEDVIDVPDDLTEDQINDEVREWVFEHLEWWYDILAVEPTA